MTSHLHHHITHARDLYLVVSLARDSFFLLLLAVPAQACVLLTNQRRLDMWGWGGVLKETGAKMKGYSTKA